jgi:hypothetical protein
VAHEIGGDALEILLGKAVVDVLHKVAVNHQLLGARGNTRRQSDYAGPGADELAEDRADAKITSVSGLIMLSPGLTQHASRAVGKEEDGCFPPWPSGQPSRGVLDRDERHRGRDLNQCPGLRHLETGDFHPGAAPEKFHATGV